MLDALPLSLLCLLTVVMLHKFHKVDRLKQTYKDNQELKSEVAQYYRENCELNTLNDRLLKDIEVLQTAYASRTAVCSDLIARNEALSKKLADKKQTTHIFPGITDVND